MDVTAGFVWRGKGQLLATKGCLSLGGGEGEGDHSTGEEGVINEA